MSEQCLHMPFKKQLVLEAWKQNFLQISIKSKGGWFKSEGVYLIH